MGGIDDILKSGHFPGVVVRGTRKGEHGNPMFKEKDLAPNYRRSQGFTAAESERLDGKIVRKKRKQAEAVRRQRRGTKRADSEMRLESTIPAGIWEAERRRTGDPYCWKHDGKALAKRHGLNFEE